MTVYFNCKYFPRYTRELLECLLLRAGATRTRPEEIISTAPDLTSRTQDSSTATTAFSTPLNPFNVTPELTEAAISQKPDKESLTPPPPLHFFI